MMQYRHYPSDGLDMSVSKMGNLWNIRAIWPSYPTTILDGIHDSHAWHDSDRWSP